MSNTYRLDIQVNADSANTALGNLKEHLIRLNNQAVRQALVLMAFQTKRIRRQNPVKAGDEAKKQVMGLKSLVMMPKAGNDIDDLKHKADGLKQRLAH